VYSFPPATTSCWASPLIIMSKRARNTQSTSHGGAVSYLAYHNYIRWAPNTWDLAWRCSFVPRLSQLHPVGPEYLGPRMEVQFRTSPITTTSGGPRIPWTSHGGAVSYLAYHNYIRWAPNTLDLAWRCSFVPRLSQLHPVGPEYLGPRMEVQFRTSPITATSGGPRIPWTSHGTPNSRSPRQGCSAAHSAVVAHTSPFLWKSLRHLSNIG